MIFDFQGKEHSVSRQRNSTILPDHVERINLHKTTEQVFAICYNVLVFWCSLLQVKIWFQNRRMKWRNSKERELLSSGGSRDTTLPNKSNPNPDLSDLNRTTDVQSENDFNCTEITENKPETVEVNNYDPMTVNSQEIFRQMNEVDDDLESVSDSGEEEIDVS